MDSKPTAKVVDSDEELIDESVADYKAGKTIRVR
jgi:hypothetical protein